MAGNFGGGMVGPYETEGGVTQDAGPVTRGETKMSSLSIGSMARVATIALLALAAGAGCATTANQGDGGTNVAVDSTPTATPPVTGEGGGANPDPTGPPATKTKTQAPPSWPTPEDCVSYNPANLTVSFNQGLYSVADGVKEVLRVTGQSGDNTGEKALALAKRYKKHCFIGRNNNRAEERNSFIFDYWRDASGQKPPIPDTEDDCGEYNRNNLTVEDMGDGHGWRVKDHDHILHLFDNGDDARNGKLVLAKYGQICRIGSDGDTDDPFYISYSL